MKVSDQRIHRLKAVTRPDKPVGITTCPPFLEILVKQESGDRLERPYDRRSHGNHPAALALGLGKGFQRGSFDSERLGLKSVFLDPLLF
jgi:hypothetical protein